MTLAELLKNEQSKEKINIILTDGQNATAMWCCERLCICTDEDNAELYFTPETDFKLLQALVKDFGPTAS